MGFLDSLRNILTGERNRSSGGGRTRFGDDAATHWVYARCQRCGEPLQARIDLLREPSLDDDGKTWIVRKGLVGAGANRCFQVVEVTLRFDNRKKRVLAADAVGGTIITAEEHQALMEGAKHAQTDSGGQLEDEQDAGGGS